MIKIQLTEEEKKQLDYYRGQASSKNSEKALIVIMSSGGKSPKRISKILKRNIHTIRKWLKRSIKIAQFRRLILIFLLFLAENIFQTIQFFYYYLFLLTLCLFLFGSGSSGLGIINFYSLMRFFW